MQRGCKKCQAIFEVTDDDLQFLDDLSPVFPSATLGAGNGKKESISAPTLCPDCRMQRRLAMYNELHLFLGQCDLCKKRILRQRLPHDTRPTYCRLCWNDDKHDARVFGAEPDFRRPFFEQIRAVKDRSPEPATYTGPALENSDYVHCADYLKNCYIIMHADHCEDCYYGYGMKNSKSCIDGYYNLQSELCYDCIYCHRCYDLIGSQDCINCSSSAFLRDCIGCKNCFLCVGLREQQHCFENKQLMPAEYAERMKAINTGSYRQYQELKSQRCELELRHPFKEFQGHNAENCTGNYLANCKNAVHCYDCEDVEDARYCAQVVTGAKTISDIYQWGLNLQRAYECSHVGDNSYNILFCTQTFLGASDVLYSLYMQGCKNCFGCANMNHARFCILNKQYTEAEYNVLVPKIIAHMRSTGEWGEFFPIGFSGYGYNLTVAQQYFPLTREEAHAQGFVWEDNEQSPPDASRIIPAEQLPDDIADITDDILQWAIVCKRSKRPFKIIPQELEQYRQRKLPLPRVSWLERHMERFRQRNPRKLWNRTCMKCQKTIQTTYAPERPEIVYCEECYLKEVY